MSQGLPRLAKREDGTWRKTGNIIFPSGLEIFSPKMEMLEKKTGNIVFHLTWKYFQQIYPSRRHNLPPTLETLIRNFPKKKLKLSKFSKKSWNFQNFPKVSKFFKYFKFLKISIGSGYITSNISSETMFNTKTNVKKYWQKLKILLYIIFFSPDIFQSKLEKIPEGLPQLPDAAILLPYI